MEGPGRPVEVREFEVGGLSDGAVLLETVASEVCGTDVHLWHGRLSGVPYPIIPGHVSVGKIAEVSGVSHDAVGVPIQKGDLVTFYDVHEICNECWHCRVAHQPNRCPARKVYGITYSCTEGLLGGWSELIYLKPGVRILRIPSGLSADQVIGGGCGLFTGFASVERARMSMGDVVVVQGTGPVGLAACAFASLSGASAVIALGEPESRRALALKLGADLALGVDGITPDARIDAVLAATGGRGADVVIEASGNPRAVEEGLALVRDGGTYVVSGHYTDAGTATINPHIDINRKHVDIRGNWGTDFSHVHRALQLLRKHSDKLPFGDVIGGRYGLDDANRALEDVAALKVTKAIIAP